MRIFFAGTPEIAVPSLEAVTAKWEVTGVLTQPDKRKGRGRGSEPSPVKRKADELDLLALQPEDLDGKFIDRVRGLNPDILVVVAYGKIFKRNFIDIFPLGGINLHPSLLPVYRGPSPITAAILGGDSETGITVQRLALKMDAGDILRQIKIPLSGRETGSSLTGRVAGLGADLLVQTLREIEESKVKAVPQDHSQATYCSIIRREDGLIHWTESTVMIDRKIRAYDSWPGAYSTFKGTPIRVLEAEPVAAAENEGYRTLFGEETLVKAEPGRVVGVDKKRGILVKTGDGFLIVTRLQLQSKKALDFISFLNGVRDFTGSLLGR